MAEAFQSIGSAMPLDPRAQRLLTMMAAAAKPARQRPSVEERRQSLAKLMQFARADLNRVTMKDGTLPGAASELRYRLYAPADQASEQLPGFVYFHGGGMVAGSIETHHHLTAALALATGCRLVSIDYRLAPEHPFPAAIEDAIAATAFAWRNAASLGIDATRLVIGGDSAGAALAAVVCQEAMQTEGVPIGAQCLICPVLDFADTSGSREAFAEGYLIDRTTLEADLADYLPEGADSADPRVSPLRAARLVGLPPAIIHTAEFDPMRDEGDAYARRLRAAGVPVAHVCHGGMIHNFHCMSALLPRAQAALAQIGEQVARMLGVPTN